MKLLFNEVLPKESDRKRLQVVEQYLEPFETEEFPTYVPDFLMSIGHLAHRVKANAFINCLIRFLSKRKRTRWDTDYGYVHLLIRHYKFERNNAALIIQKGCHNWLYKPICKDGKHGINVTIGLRNFNVFK